MLTAADLIAQSIRDAEIATADWTPDLETDLLAAAADNVDASPTVEEFWGDVDGKGWRVHLLGERGELEPPAGYVERAVDRARREGVIS